MKKNLFITFALIIIIIIVTAIIMSGKNKSKSDYSTEATAKCDITETVEASGTVNPVKTVNIGTQVSGKISAIYVDYNSKVKKGQLLAQIDPSLFQAQVDKATGDLINAESNYNKTKSMYIYNKANYERYKKLYAKNYVSKSETELAYAEYKSKEAELAAMRGLIEQARATLKNNETNLGYTKIVSSVDGVVVSRKVDVGQTVAASFQTPEMFTVAQDLTQMQIEVSVSEADIGKIEIGQKADYTLDGYPDAVFEGTVSQIRIAPTTVSNVTTYTVIVTVTNDEDILKPGMSANVTIITRDKKGVLCVPNDAFKFVPPGTDAKYKELGIWVIKKSKPERISVKKGLKNNDYTEVLGDEVREGMRVCVPRDKKNDKSVHPPMRMF